MNSTSPNRARSYLVIACLSCVGLLLAAVATLSFVAQSSLFDRTVAPDQPPPTLNVVARQRVERFCSACHRLPDASHFPKAAWHHEVERGFQFYNESGRTDLEPPPLQQVVAYYQSAAPERLVIPEVASSAMSPPVAFRQARFPTEKNRAGSSQVAISAVNWLQRTPGGVGELYCSDMRRGEVLKVSLGPDVLQSEMFAKIPHPVVSRVCDLDTDGKTELVVADLGSFLPEDHDLGKVWWLRSEGNPTEGQPILAGIGRVADLQPVDVDVDGDQDLLVAEFGWHQTGGIHLLENHGLKDGQLQLVRHKLDPRAGTIHLSVTDLNGDQRPDFIALISQEHESAVAFLNQGDLQFKPRLLGEALDPASGSSGMSLVDLDLDHDLDLLVTNGDSFDSFYLKPAHSVFWLENRGDLNYVRHHLTYLPGAHRALAGDVDGDGDSDIVAAAFLPQEPRAQQPGAEFDSLILLEQTAPRAFQRHRLESGECHHTALEMADFDEDGDPDVAVSNFTEMNQRDLPPLTVWWNLRKD